MKNLFKKVDRVKDINEAIELEKLGVDFIGVSLIEDPRFSDNRKVSGATALSIRKVLKKSTLVGEIALNSNWNQIISLVKSVGFDYIQVWDNQIVPEELKQQLLKLDIGIIYSNIEASHEDDPSWIIDETKSNKNISKTFFQVDLLGEVENSWHFLNQETPKYPDEELQIEDINNLAEKYPLFITLDYTPMNIVDIVSQLLAIKGITMTIAQSSARKDIHCFDYSTTLDIISKLNQTNILIAK